METKMSVYYRTAENKLRLITTWATPDKDSIKLVFQDVLAQLHKEMEHYHKPILILMNGGKA